jgi:Transglutaminase-like enzymes, putative cysteine proteases
MKKLVLILLAALFLFSCENKNKHFMSDKNYRLAVEAQFEKRKEQAAHRSEALFSVFDKEDLSLRQKEALQFLYAYMPLSDLADYDGEFFLRQVDAAFQARDYFNWGKTVPEDIFRHFVMVYRVNNEYLDTARMVFFDELKERIKDLSMYDAALEVNHWCHEKVTYRGTDGRTSAPLALVKTSWGRCGEESTFTTTALRAVGIPARQVYTPRWVHTDSNHAWVEVWIDGKWHYLGACEPDYELDRAWFDGPAKRAMMMHTNVFGRYEGPEEKTLETPLYSIINLLENYADTRVVNVYVQDVNGAPVDDAKVQFKVYNFAELTPIATTHTDEGGKTSVISGMGDIMVWANKDDRFGYIKSTPDDETVTVVLDHHPGVTPPEEFVMNVPPEKPVGIPDSVLLAANAVRFVQEDSIRNAYMSTFPDEAFAKKLSEETALHEADVWKYISLSQGNWQEIERFIREHHTKPELFPFLASLTEKDLRDTPAAYLNDHINHRDLDSLALAQETWVKYIQSPRIGLELIKPWRSYLQRQFGAEQQAIFRNDVSLLIDYIKGNIILDEEENYYNCRITPQGVHELKIADARSRDGYFIALCRSFAIPARIERATGKPQYMQGKHWVDAVFDAPQPGDNQAKGYLGVNNDKNNVVKPIYGSHYTIAQYDDGDYHTLNFRSYPDVRNFPYMLELTPGFYRLMAGSRANDGSVFVSEQYFEILPEGGDIVTVKLPAVEGKLFVKGIIDMNTIVDTADGKTTLKDLSNGKGIMLCFVDPGKEPSIHILQDLPATGEALGQWGGGVLMLIPDDKVNATFNPANFKGLPAQTAWATDYGRSLLNEACSALQLQWKDNFPLTLYLTANGGILFSSEGYRIGIGENILRTINEELKTKR